MTEVYLENKGQVRMTSQEPRTSWRSIRFFSFRTFHEPFRASFSLVETRSIIN
jgi:hypothetical protein